MKEGVDEFTTKVLKCEKGEDGSLDLVVKGEGDLDITGSMLGAKEYCFVLAEEQRLLDSDNYGDERKRLIKLLSDLVFEKIANNRVDVDKLRLKVKKRINFIIESANDKQNSLKDDLTKLRNFKYLDEEVRRMFNNNKRGDKKPISFIMFDIDKFKDINDTYGHDAGDDVLRQIAEMMKDFVRTKEGSELRDEDFCIRKSGDEFFFVLFGCNKEDAIVRGEQFRKNIEANEFQLDSHGKKVSKSIELSMGISSFDPENGFKEDGFEALIKEVDMCMYASKKNGRNNLAYLKKNADSSRGDVDNFDFTNYAVAA